MLAATIATIAVVVILFVVAIARIIDEPPHKRMFRLRRKERMRITIIDHGREQIIGDGPWR
jgi:hypothetical protein